MMTWSRSPTTLLFSECASNLVITKLGPIDVASDGRAMSSPPLHVWPLMGEKPHRLQTRVELEVSAFIRLRRLRHIATVRSKPSCPSVWAMRGHEGPLGVVCCSMAALRA